MTNVALMNRHDPDNKSFRVAVIRKTDYVTVGSMPAMPGMQLAFQDKVVKVNPKSIMVEKPGCTGTWRVAYNVSVFLDEAKRFGYV